MMITAFVKYKEFKESQDWQVDGHWLKKSKIVEVPRLTDLNVLFEHITHIKILKEDNYD